MAVSLNRGESMADELGFVATRMPLYTGVLSLFVGMEHGVVAAKAFQWIVGALGAVFVAGLARSVAQASSLCAHRQDAGAAIGLIAGIMVAIDPYLIYFSSLLLTETLFIALLPALWWSLVPLMCGYGTASHRGDGKPARPSWWRWLVTAVLACLCVYTRESSLAFILAGLGCVLIVWHRRLAGVRAGVVGVALVLAVLIGSLVPWSLRNHRLTWHLCWLTHRGGISLYDGVGPQATGASDLGNIKNMEAVRSYVESGDEAGWNQYFLDRSFEAVAEDPIRIAGLALIKLKRTWNVVPNLQAGRHPLIQWVSAAWTIPIYVLAIIGVGILTLGNAGDSLIGNGGAIPSWVAALFLLLPAVVVSALHAFFVGSVRYRLGAMPAIEILAAVAVVCVWTKCRKRCDRGGSAASGC